MNNISTIDFEYNDLINLHFWDLLTEKEEIYAI